MVIQMLEPIITNWSRQQMVTSHKKFLFDAFFYKVSIYIVCICILYIPRHAYTYWILLNCIWWVKLQAYIWF